MGEPEDDDPAKVRSVLQGCGEFGINHLVVRSSGGDYLTGLGLVSRLPPRCFQL
jgi:hypothetical protein